MKKQENQNARAIILETGRPRFRNLRQMLRTSRDAESIEEWELSSTAGMVGLALLLLLLSIFGEAAVANAQTTAPTAEEKLEQEFTDPLTDFPQVIIRDSYSPANYGTDVRTNVVLVRPIFPRLPNYTLLPFPELVRPTFAMVTVPSSRGGTRTEFGDLPLFDLAVLPWPGGKKVPLLIGVGPTFVFPTATSRSAGQGAWQAGPALGAVYSGIPGLLIGFICQNPVSFAYSSSNRPPQNTLEVQPVLALHLWRQWYLRSAEATWMMGWHRHTSTTLPLSAGIGRTIVRPGLPPMSLFVTGQWTLYRQFAPVTPQTTINFGITIGFPEFRPW
jgi:hypothetical protein